jgi:NAD(P)-dependent dehydrogenase (short-subunit alcohol dehydrogenase family)
VKVPYLVTKELVVASLRDPKHRPLPHLVAATVDDLLEATIIGSFSKIGFEVRQFLWSWPAPHRVDGKTFLVTGASSGIGRAIAENLAQRGARLWLHGRDKDRMDATRTAVMAAGAAWSEVLLSDLSTLDGVSAVAEAILQSNHKLNGLIHNAGVLHDAFGAAEDGTELTLATNVLAPFRLTTLLSPRLRKNAATIVTVSSGGMYTQRFDLDHLASDRDSYKGVTAYARTKRAQVVLAHEWARRWKVDGVKSYVMHPGWAETPGLANSLPSVARLGPLLRTPAQGADTAAWLASDGPANESSKSDGRRPRDGGIWLDRRLRRMYYLPNTYVAPSRRLRDGQDLWAWCEARSGIPEPSESQ